MFQIGEYVIYEGKGVCEVTDVVDAPFPGMSRDKKYYLMQPVYTKGSQIYTSVDNDKVVMRKVLAREEADALVNMIPEIPTIDELNERERENLIKEAIRTHNCQELVKVIKTVYLRRRDRLDNGKKVLASDERFMQSAEKNLYEELGFALSMEPKDVAAYIAEKINSI